MFHVGGHESSTGGYKNILISALAVCSYECHHIMLRRFEFFVCHVVEKIVFGRDDTYHKYVRVCASFRFFGEDVINSKNQFILFIA